MVEHEFYAQHLLCLGHGLAIYEPDPADEYDELCVGDVGHMKDGGFHRLFNVFRKEDDKVNKLGVPEGFEPLLSEAGNTYSRLPLPAGVMASSTVVQQGGGLGAGLAPGLPLQAGASIQLSCSNRLGAALITSHPSYRLDSSATLTLSKYMLKNYRSWVHFARDRLGRDITVKDVVLVTGRDLTNQWATATFVERHRDAGISFQVGDGFGSIIGGAGLTLWGSWSSNLLVPHRCGPQRVKPPGEGDTSENAIARIHGGPEGLAPPSSKYNQCVFIRGFRIRERTRFLPKVIKAAAEGADRDDASNYDPDHLSPLVATEMDRSANTSTDSEQIELIHGTPERDGQMGRIYDVFAQHIFEKTDADVALLHDDEICVPFQCELIETPEELRECLNNAVSDATYSVEDTNGVKVGRWIPPKLDITRTIPAVTPAIEVDTDTFTVPLENSWDHAAGGSLSTIEELKEEQVESTPAPVAPSYETAAMAQSNTKSRSRRVRILHVPQVESDEEEGEGSTLVGGGWDTSRFPSRVDMGAKAQVATDDQGTKLPGDGTRSHPDLASEQLGFAALVDQQREIMRYMRGLDKWMERERTARSELLGSLNEKLDQMKAPLQSKLSESMFASPDKATPDRLYPSPPSPVYDPPHKGLLPSIPRETVPSITNAASKFYDTKIHFLPFVPPLPPGIIPPTTTVSTADGARTDLKAVIGNTFEGSAGHKTQKLKAREIEDDVEDDVEDDGRTLAHSEHSSRSRQIPGGSTTSNNKPWLGGEPFRSDSIDQAFARPNTVQSRRSRSSYQTSQEQMGDHIQRPVSPHPVSPPRVVFQNAPYSFGSHPYTGTPQYGMSYTNPPVGPPPFFTSPPPATYPSPQYVPPPQYVSPPPSYFPGYSSYMPMQFMPTSAPLPAMTPGYPPTLRPVQNTDPVVVVPSSHPLTIPQVPRSPIPATTVSYAEDAPEDSSDSGSRKADIQPPDISSLPVGSVPAEPSVDSPTIQALRADFDNGMAILSMMSSNLDPFLTPMVTSLREHLRKKEEYLRVEKARLLKVQTGIVDSPPSVVGSVTSNRGPDWRLESTSADPNPRPPSPGLFGPRSPRQIAE